MKTTAKLAICLVVAAASFAANAPGFKVANGVDDIAALTSHSLTPARLRRG